MTKKFLIAGGTAVVSLAVGTAGGYFIAKKRFEAGLGVIIERETEAIKKHYSIMLMEARSGKPESPEDIPERDDETEDTEEEEESEEELTEADQAVIQKGRKTLSDAAKALTDYQGISTKIVSEGGDKPELSTLVQKNIFDTDKAKKPRPLPPRGEGGKFRKQTVREAENDPPQIIDGETFLLNDTDYAQESLLYFINDKTLVMAADPNESLDTYLVGEVNLTLFPDVPEGAASMIYVRNDGMSTDYEIKRMDESLTEYLGLGENGDRDDEDEDEELDESAYL